MQTIMSITALVISLASYLHTVRNKPFGGKRPGMLLATAKLLEDQVLTVGEGNDADTAALWERLSKQARDAQREALAILEVTRQPSLFIERVWAAGCALLLVGGVVSTVFQFMPGLCWSAFALVFALIVYHVAADESVRLARSRSQRSLSEAPERPWPRAESWADLRDLLARDIRQLRDESRQGAGNPPPVPAPAE